jgi:sugar lactone lactonase YvrE
LWYSTCVHCRVGADALWEILGVAYQFIQKGRVMKKQTRISALSKLARIFAGPALVIAGVTVLAACTIDGPAYANESRPELLLSMPAYCNTPDGMTLDSSGNIIMSCPNFNDPAYPGVLVKIDTANKLSLYYPMPVHPDTNRGCPLGLDFGPDGNLYVCDNQYFTDTASKSRLIKIIIKNGEPVAAEVAVDGLNLANAAKWKGDSVYITDTFFDAPDGLSTSGVYRIALSEMQKGIVRVKHENTDPHLIATFTTVPDHKNATGGANGMVFDSKGNLYIGLFGNGEIYKLTFDDDGKVASNTLFVKSDKMTCTDGIDCDLRTDDLYITDPEKNAVHVVSPSGELRTLWQNGDTDGSDGLLDMPSEPIIRGDELILANFDMPFAGVMNTEYDEHHTMSVIKLER